MTRVAIVDDHPVVREGLVAALEGKNGVEVVGVFSTAEEALGRLKSAPTLEVVILDLELPGMSGLDAIPALSRSAAVLVLSAYGENIEEAIRAGARGYLLKGAPLDEIAAVARGESYIDPPLASRLVTRSPERLTEREREVLRLVARGQSNKEIAAKLRISERTAKFHVTAILNKLGAENRAQAVAIAAQRRLV